MGLFGDNSEPVLGLDIGYESLKLVEVNKSKKSINLVGAIEVPLVERILERDHFKNISKTANIIKEACRKAKPSLIKAKRIVTALPESFVFSKTIQMPKMTDEEYKKAIPIEAAQNLPIPVEDVYIDYQILITHPEEPMTDILLVASPKKIVDEFVKMTQEAGLVLAALETKPIAVGRAVSTFSPLNDIIIVEIGTEVTRLSIWDKNMIRLSATINTAKNQILESLANDNPSLTKTEPRTIDPEKDTSVILTLGNISTEIINTIKYYQNRSYRFQPIKKLLLCGSGAMIGGVKEIFEKETKIETQIIKPSFSNKTSLGSDFITAFGLSLRSNFN